MKIIEATPEHAATIAAATRMAIGEELYAGIDVRNGNADKVEAMFADLAGRADSQYSFRNTLLAVDDTADPSQPATVMGVIVGYDGGQLETLRAVFLEEAGRRFGFKFEGEIVGETSAEEYYIDTLAVFPKYRSQGVATALINAMGRRAKAAHLPLGLLVAKHNSNARNLYEKTGFRPVGERPFAGELMDNLRQPLDKN